MNVVLKIAESIVILVLSSLEIPLTFTFPQSIWRIIPHPLPTENRWAIELRDAETRTASWAILDLDEGVVCWQTTPEATDWWTTLTAFAGDNLLLHNYRYPDIPEPTDLLAVAVANGQLRWATPGVVFVRDVPEEKSLLVAHKRGEGVEYKFLDPESGLILGRADSSLTQPDGLPTGTSPVRYLPGEPYFELVTTFMEKIVGKHPWEAVDYVESNPYIAFSYYLYEQEKMVQRLLIIDSHKAIVYHETLSRDRQGIGRDTIYLKSGILLCLCNNNQLISIKLRPQ